MSLRVGFAGTPAFAARALAAIADELRADLPPDDPLAGYAERLSEPGLRSSVRGYLTGSIDLVVRLREASGVERFAIADYKTNWLAGPDEELSAWHHRPAALAAEMARAHYGLQALLYLGSFGVDGRTATLTIMTMRDIVRHDMRDLAQPTARIAWTGSNGVAVRSGEGNGTELWSDAYATALDVPPDFGPIRELRFEAPDGPMEAPLIYAATPELDALR